MGGAPPGTSGGDLAGELTRVRERLVAYSRFDEQVHQTIVQSGELLRTAEAMHQGAANEIAASLTAMERALDAERHRQASALTAVIAELEETQRQATDLTRVLVDVARQAGRLARQVEQARITLRSETKDVPAAQVWSNPDPMADVAPIESPDATDLVLESAIADPGPSLTASSPHPMTLVFERVPNVVVADSLQRHVTTIPGLTRIVAREYTAGVLRLHVIADRSIHSSDLRSWSDGPRLEPVQDLIDTVVVRIPGTGRLG